MCISRILELAANKYSQIYATRSVQHYYFTRIKVGRYFDREIWEDKITGEFSAPVLHRHRPFEDYVQVLLREQFLLRDLREAEPTADELKKSYRFRKLTRIPYFLFMRWEKS